MKSNFLKSTDHAFEELIQEQSLLQGLTFMICKKSTLKWLHNCHREKG